MRIRLINFLCYTDSTFDFGEQGLALLSGPSGAGKTSILKGIFFALFGEGKKLPSYGKDSCKVELEFDGMKIVRTKRPNRLVVDDIYEDAAAQEIINKKFGDTFKTSGYIQQNNLASFILMSPIDKLAFLEKFTFRDVDLGTIKGRCKAYISKKYDELLGVISQLDMARNIVDEMDPPNEVKFPIKCNVSQREKAEKNEHIKLKNRIILTRKYENERKAIESEISDLKVLEATLLSRREMCNDHTQKLKKIENDILNTEYEGDEKLEKYIKKLDNYLLNKEKHELESSYKDLSVKLAKMKEDEEINIKDKISVIESELWSEYTKKDIQDNKDSLSDFLTDMKSVEKLKGELETCNVDRDMYDQNVKNLEQYENELSENQELLRKSLLQKKTHSCPSCKSSVRFVDNKLVLVEDALTEEIDSQSIKNKIDKLQKSVDKLRKVIPVDNEKLKRHEKIQKNIDEILGSYESEMSADDVRADLQYIKDYEKKHINMEKEIHNLRKVLETENFSSSYKSFKNEVLIIEERLRKMENISEYESGLDEDELRNFISDQKQRKLELKKLEMSKIELEKELKKHREILENAEERHRKTYSEVRDYTKLQNEIKEIEIKLEKYENEMEQCKNNISQIEKWKKYQEELENYQVWLDKVEKLEKDEKEARKQYASTTELRDKILEAESVAMTNIIDSINTHARVYLDYFFTDNPISVQLQTFKETKKNTKPKINIVIEYKGMEADIGMLSGGELSRVILAYTLALAEMFNTPLILLDECTASLDQDLTNTVFEAIRENFNGKIALIIAHQVITGTFDTVIKL